VVMSAMMFILLPILSRYSEIMNRSCYLKKHCLFYISTSMLLIVAEAAGQSLTIGGRNQTLTVTTGIAGSQLMSVINANNTLTYITPPGGGHPIYIITVSTSCLGQRLGLSVLATNVPPGNEGTPAPEVALISGDPGVNFITDIEKKNSVTCTLQYTASAVFAQGNSNDVGNDVHTVTYTLQLE